MLVVQAVQPSEDVTRCIGPHAAELELDGVSPGNYSVSVRRIRGEEQAKTQLTVK